MLSFAVAAKAKKYRLQDAICAKLTPYTRRQFSELCPSLFIFWLLFIVKTYLWARSYVARKTSFQNNIVPVDFAKLYLLC